MFYESVPFFVLHSAGSGRPFQDGVSFGIRFYDFTLCSVRPTGVFQTPAGPDIKFCDYIFRFLLYVAEFSV